MYERLTVLRRVGEDGSLMSTKPTLLSSGAKHEKKARRALEWTRTRLQPGQLVLECNNADCFNAPTAVQRPRGVASSSG